MAEKNIRLVIEYDGTRYAGWQWQKGQETIQGALIEAIFRVTGQKVPVLGAGRTDAGVHALGQVANFRIDHTIPPERYRDAMNAYLDDDIRVKSAEEVALDFHARRDATFRRYRYLVASERSALYRTRRWEQPAELDFELLQAAAAEIEGEHDFAPFCVVGSRKESNVCQIFRARWYRWGPLLVFEIRGNRFLHSMVRSLVGAMVNLAQRRQDGNSRNLTLDSFADIIRFPDEKRVVFTAPAHGLYLVKVGYERELTT